jgi:acyl-CoA synthetase (AMP-forming)/AMP-acid ligase II
MDGAVPIARLIAPCDARGFDRIAMRFLERGEIETVAMSATHLDRRGREIAAFLVERGLAGSAVILTFDPGPGFVEALVGCLYAGAVAVPAPAPRPGSSLERLEAIAAGSNAAAMLTSAALVETLAARAAPDSRLRALPLLLLDDAAGGETPALLPGFDRDPEAPAIIQFTSGSTGIPRGVVLNSACLGANIEMASRGMDVGQDGRREMLINWMPHYHDMGLIGKILIPLALGLEVAHLPPLAFVQRPERWLKAISHYRATTSGAPAFAFDLCASRIPDAVIDQLDLSSWRTAFCGAEPVFASTLDRFWSRFARAGLRREALFACYGLAEVSLYAAGSHAPSDALPQSPSPWARAPIFLDAASREAIRIIRPDRTVAHDGEEGEIWICCPSVAAGYLGAPEDTALAFGARLLPDDGNAWLRTGDLGMIADGALTVMGRIKDVLIRNGVNVAAADVERIATRGLPQLNPNGAAAFQGPDVLGAPLVLMVERERSAAAIGRCKEVERRVRGAVFDGLGIMLDEVCILRPGTLPRTTSGKVRRAAVRDAWAADHVAPAEAC